MLRSGYRVGKLDGGPKCEELERALEEHYGVPFARVFNSATSALHAALVAVGVERGDFVGVSPYSMSASVTCALHAQAQPLFMDIKYSDYCIDFSRRSHNMNQWEKPKSAVVLPHLFGYHAEYPIHAIWPIVHDCAQSPSFRMDERRRNDVAVYSLNQHKVIQCGEGGYALCWRKEIADRLHAVRNHGECYTDDILGCNYRMTEMQAEAALDELPALDLRLEERRAVCRTYWPESRNRDWFLAPALGIEISGATAKRGYHQVIYNLPYFKKHGIGFSRGAPCPVAEEIERYIVLYDPDELVRLERAKAA